MREMMLLSICGLLLACGTASGQTPDGETPANDGVCDVLLGATPGLYGLCVAFCEAQDCEPDRGVDDPFAACRPSAPKLLEIYNRKKQPGDPDMPCLLPDCPCFATEDIPRWDTHCWIDQIIYGGGGLNTVVWDCPQGCSSDTCTLFNASYAGVSAFPEKACYLRDSSANRFLLVSDAEYESCRNLVVNAIENGDADCSCGLLQEPQPKERPGGGSRGPRCNKPFETVIGAGVSGVRDAQRRVIETEAEWCSFWSEVHAFLLPSPPCDLMGVDFSREAVLIVALGPRPNSCYGVHVDSVHGGVGSDNRVVRYRETTPGPDCACAMVITHPYHAVKVDKPVGRVRFVGENATYSCDPPLRRRTRDLSRLGPRSDVGGSSFPTTSSPSKAVISP